MKRLWLWVVFLMILVSPIVVPAADIFSGGPDFRIDDFHVQGEAKAGTPALLRVRSGQKFYMVILLDVSKPSPIPTKLAYTYTVTWQHGPNRGQSMEIYSSSSTLPANFKGGAQLVSHPTSLSLDTERQDSAVLKVAVTMNGVTQIKTTQITVLP